MAQPCFYRLWREYIKGGIDGMMGTDVGLTLVPLLPDRVPCLTEMVAIVTIVLRL